MSPLLHDPFTAALPCPHVPVDASGPLAHVPLVAEAPLLQSPPALVAPPAQVAPKACSKEAPILRTTGDSYLLPIKQNNTSFFRRPQGRRKEGPCRHQLPVLGRYPVSHPRPIAANPKLHPVSAFKPVEHSWI